MNKKLDTLLVVVIYAAVFAVVGAALAIAKYGQ